jgi:hypothetical protein
VPQALALLAGLLFLLHPANAETAAWIFQLKTLLALSFGLGALLALRARPLLATGLFGLALLCKPSASAVLPAALVFEWLRVPGPSEPARRTRWLLGWGALLLLYALPEFTAFRNIGEFRGELPLGASLLQAVAILGRYLVLSLSSLGSSTFHQPTPPASPLDAWFGLGVLALLALALASFDALRGRRLAAGWLALAAAAYLPVAQLFPFRYPMADRYLYFVLPGLLGASISGRRCGAARSASRPTRPHTIPTGSTARSCSPAGGSAPATSTARSTRSSVRGRAATRARPRSCTTRRFSRSFRSRATSRCSRA